MHHFSAIVKRSGIVKLLQSSSLEQKITIQQRTKTDSVSRPRITPKKSSIGIFLLGGPGTAKKHVVKKSDTFVLV